MKIERNNVTAQVVEYLTANINNGEWKPGEKIPSENTLTQELGVSRASIRAAIGQLIGLGVLESVHGKGTFLLRDRVEDVPNPQEIITAEDCREIDQVLEFRRILEPSGCYLAAEHMTPQTIARLEECLHRMERANHVDRDAFIRADMGFHEVIAEASGNKLIEKSLHRIFTETAYNHRQMNAIFGYESGLYHHRRIMESLKAGNAREASERMEEHMKDACQTLAERLKESESEA